MNSTAPSSLPADTWVVGDDRTTDIPMGLAAGTHTVLVRTGKFSSQSSDPALPEAEFTIGSIAELPEMLARVLA